MNFYEIITKVYFKKPKEIHIFACDFTHKMNKPVNQPLKAVLELEDGSRYEGFSFGHEAPVAGEVVFYTAMTGYPESLTDPSYKGQILVPTYPMIGNYGVPFDEDENGISKFFESSRIHCTALVISDYSAAHSHWNSQKSLGQWLKEEKIPGLYGIDTRELTKKLREKGSMKGRILFGGMEEVPFMDPNAENLVAQVSTRNVKTFGSGKYKVTLVDCGLKLNILRCLLKHDVTVKVVPWDYDFTADDYDGLFLSNGPGDPARCDKTIEHIAKVLSGNKPIMGICLGNQLMARAAGADTYKLKYGHRSHNQPVMRPGTTRCYITSQNHGFAIDDSTLPADWEPLFINVNDNTNEGIRHRTKPFFSAQFHPEASSGPVDTEYLFDEFIDRIRESKK